MKKCPYCAELIQDEAIKCRFCGSDLVAGGVPGGSAADAVGRQEALQYTHSGSRYLLGYGPDSFGIWDRQRPGPPVESFPRTDEGWRRAWLAFTAKEPYSAEVGIGAAPASATSPPSTSTPGASPGGWGGPAGSRGPARVSGAWWLLPIFMGWLGGLIAWLVNKDLDPHRARAMLVTGIAISVALVVLVVISTAPSSAS